MYLFLGMLIQIHPVNPEAKKIKTIIECLNDGGVIIYPTDTVYSIGCSLVKVRAIERVARIKGIKPEKAQFSIVCNDLSNIAEYAKVDTPTYKIMKKALPGPYTFILQASSKVPRYFNMKKNTIGIRVPDHALCLELVKELTFPIISTSVHDDDELIEYTTDPELIHEKYQKLVDIVIDGGYGNNVASTIIDCSGKTPEVIREGIGETDFL